MKAQNSLFDSLSFWQLIYSIDRGSSSYLSIDVSKGLGKVPHPPTRNDIRNVSM